MRLQIPIGTRLKLLVSPPPRNKTKFPFFSFAFCLRSEICLGPRALSRCFWPAQDHRHYADCFLTNETETARPPSKEICGKGNQAPQLESSVWLEILEYSIVQDKPTCKQLPARPKLAEVVTEGDVEEKKGCFWSSHKGSLRL